MNDKKIGSLYLITGIIILFLPIIAYNLIEEKELNDLPCYDNRNNLIEGLKCSGTYHPISEIPLFLFIILLSGSVFIIIGATILIDIIFLPIKTKR